MEREATNSVHAEESTEPFAGVSRSETPQRDRTTSTVRRVELADADLVHGIATGDHDALAEAYERHGASVHGLAQHVCGPRHADDVVQEVFLRLWREPQAFDAHRGSLRNFLLMMTRSRSIDLLRSNNARRGREEKLVTNAEPERQELDIDLIAEGERARIADAVNGLSDPVRDAIFVAFYGRCTYVEAAVVLGAPEGTAKSRIRSGLLELRRQLSDLLEGDEPSWSVPARRADPATAWRSRKRREQDVRETR